MLKLRTTLLATCLTLLGAFSAPSDAGYGYATAVFSSQAASDNFCNSHDCLAQYSVPNSYTPNNTSRYYALYTI